MVGVAGEAELGARPELATFEELLGSCSTSAFHLAHTMLGDVHEAEDAVQEAAVRAWTRFDRFRRDASFRTWFLTIVANQCRSVRRTRWFRLRGDAEVPEVPLASHEAATVARLDVRGLVARLPRHERALLYLSYELDLPQAEIARILGVRTGTVKTRLHRVVTRLRRAVEED